MNVSDWIQENWYELASVMAQFGILIAVAWYGRARLQLLRGAEPAGAAAAVEPASYAVPEHEATPAGFAGVGRLLSASPAIASPAHEKRALRRKRRNTWRAIVRWLQEPMRA